YSDRHADPRAISKLARFRRPGTRRLGVIVNAGRTTGAQYGGRHALRVAVDLGRCQEIFESPPCFNRNVSNSLADAENRCSRSVGFEADYTGVVGAEHPADLPAYRRKDLQRRYSPCDPRRNAPQRRLLIEEPSCFFSSFAIGDRCRDEIGEIRET